MGITTKAPASKRISFPKLGRLALPSNGTPMYSWQCVSAITFALGRCADIAESLSTEQRRGSWTWSVKLWGRLRRSIPQDLDQTDTVTPEDPEMADSRPPPTPVLRNDQVLKELLDLSELLVAGGNELGKAILERRRAWDWRAGRFRAGDLYSTYGSVKRELETPMKTTLDKELPVDIIKIRDWTETAQRLIEAALKDTKPREEDIDYRLERILC